MTSEDSFCNLKIANLSAEEFTEGQIKLLSRSLKLTPTPKNDMSDIHADINTEPLQEGTEKEIFLG